MKGVVYTLFNRMIEERFGLPAWEQLLERAQLRSGGIYTAGAVYDDAELFALVRELEQVSGVEQAELVRTFGEYLIGAFGRFHPEMFTGSDTKSFGKAMQGEVLRHKFKTPWWEWPAGLGNSRAGFPPPPPGRRRNPQATQEVPRRRSASGSWLLQQALQSHSALPPSIASIAEPAKALARATETSSGGGWASRRAKRCALLGPNDSRSMR